MSSSRKVFGRSLLRTYTAWRLSNIMSSVNTTCSSFAFISSAFFRVVSYWAFTSFASNGDAVMNIDLNSDFFSDASVVFCIILALIASAVSDLEMSASTEERVLPVPDLPKKSRFSWQYTISFCTSVSFGSSLLILLS